MHDQRVIRRTTFHQVDAPDCCWLFRIGSESVDGFRGNRGKPTGTKACDRQLDISGEKRIRHEKIRLGTASRNSSAASMNANDSGVAK